MRTGPGCAQPLGPLPLPLPLSLPLPLPLLLPGPEFGFAGGAADSGLGVAPASRVRRRRRPLPAPAPGRRRVRSAGAGSTTGAVCSSDVFTVCSSCGSGVGCGSGAAEPNQTVSPIAPTAAVRAAAPTIRCRRRRRASAPPRRASRRDEGIATETPRTAIGVGGRPDFGGLISGRVAVGDGSCAAATGEGHGRLGLDRRRIQRPSPRSDLQSGGSRVGIQRGHRTEQRTPAVSPLAGDRRRRRQAHRDGFDGGLRGEGAASRERLEQDEPEAVDVGRGCRRMSAHLLRRDVRGGPHRHSRCGHPRRVRDVGDSEICQHCAERVVGGQGRSKEDVRRLDVAVDDPRCDARRAEPRRDRSRAMRHPAERSVRGRSARRACRPRHAPSRGTTGRRGTDAHRTGSRARGDSPRREVSSRTHAGSASVSSRGTDPEDLHGDFPLEDVVGRPPHRPHAAFADQLFEPIASAEHVSGSGRTGEPQLIHRAHPRTSSLRPRVA